jgi:hypothetical protein
VRSIRLTFKKCGMARKRTDSSKSGSGSRFPVKHFFKFARTAPSRAAEAGCGVEFLASAPAAGQEPIDFARRLRRLEAEKAVLEARVAQLSSAE